MTGKSEAEYKAMAMFIMESLEAEGFTPFESAEVLRALVKSILQAIATELDITVQAHVHAFQMEEEREGGGAYER